jgi:hypothetical protein
MKRLKSCVLILIFLASCTRPVPENVISEDDMVKVLTDFHIASGYAAIRSDSVKQNMSTYINAVYKKHHIDTAGFRRSLQFYSEEPGRLIKIYEHVSENLMLEEKKLLQSEKPHLTQPVNEDTTATPPQQ